MLWRAIPLLAAFLAQCSSRPIPATLGAGGNRIVRIKLAASGGFAAIPGLNMEATLDLSGNSARVTQAEGDYTRALSAQETEEVRRMLDPVRIFQLPKELRNLNSTPDQRQYDISIQLDDGREHTVTVSELQAAELDRMSPGLGKFLEWTKQEFEGIKNHKLQKR